MAILEAMVVCLLLTLFIYALKAEYEQEQNNEVEL
jgi:hypothetical protein